MGNLVYAEWKIVLEDFDFCLSESSPRILGPWRTKRIYVSFMKKDPGGW